MADAKSDYLERKILDHALGTTTFTKPTTVYVALFTTNPVDAGSGTEVTGGSYARQSVTFASASTSSGTTTAVSNAGVTFTNLPTATITHMALYDASTSGNLLYYGALTASKSVTSGDNFTINSGQLSIEEQ